MPNHREESHLPIVGLVGAGLLLWLLTRGDSGGHGESGKGHKDDAAAKPCGVRVSNSGLTVDGTSATILDTTTRCRRVGAEVVVTGDAREGDWHALRAALDAAGVIWSLRSAAAGATV